MAHDYFADYDSTQIIGKIDFCIAVPQDGAELFETESLLWAEAKAGTKKDIYESFVQLILTIGKARTFDSYLPPAFLGAFDAEKIAFLPYTNIIDVFYQNDFNWNVTSNDHEMKEFWQLYGQVKTDIERDVLLYRFGTDDKELHKFISGNFIVGKSRRLSKIRINKNNFTHISPEAQAVLDAGRELWRYYHAQPDANPNAALYDIRLHFQGTNAKGKMNADSNDARYTELITALRQHLKQLARKIEPKVYEYGFLLK